MIDSLSQDILSLSQLWNKRTNATPDRGVLGDENGVIVDPQLPLTNVYVRLKTSNGLSPGRSVILPASTRISLTPGLPVLIGYNYKLQPIVLGIDTETQAATGVASQTSIAQNNSGRTTQAVIETLNITAGGTLTVNLKGWNGIVNGVYYEFSYSGINLASFVPSAGYECWAAVFVLSDLSGVETFASTPNLTSDFPDPVSEINECIVQRSSGSTPAWAVRLTGGLASFDQTYLDNNTKDLRQMVNNAVGELTVYRVVTAAGAVTVTLADRVIVVNKSSGAATTVNLPSNPAGGLTFTIKDGKGDAGSNNITITPASGNIDGSGSSVISTNYGKATVMYNGTQWNVIG